MYRFHLFTPFFHLLELRYDYGYGVDDNRVAEINYDDDDDDDDDEGAEGNYEFDKKSDHEP